MSSSTPAIRIEGLGKRYTIRHQGAYGYTALRDVISEGVAGLGARLTRRRTPTAQPTREQLWALRDLNFELGQGERLGIIGRNGAGKSTLLKILSRITEPTEGRVTVRGRVGSLLEVGTGFHPELTGRENIFLNGIILGMSRQEVRRKFDEIVEFAEVTRFLDTPVKRYSSGMYVRLAFAVAAHLEPETLIVDEVLAVGDAAFQRKCLGKMGEVAEGGRTVILVSHNMAAISQLCSRAIWLHEGRLKLAGPTDEVVTAYGESYSGGGGGGPFSQHGVMGDGRVKLLSYEVLNEDLRPAPLPVTGKDLTVRMRVEVTEPISQPQVGISLWTASGILLTSVGTEQQGVELEPWPAGEMDVDVVVRDCAYLPGPYKADIWVMGPQGMHAHAEDAIQFEIGESQIYGTSQVDQGWGCVFSDIEFVGPRSHG